MIPLYENDEQENLVIGEDEDGNEVTLQIVDYFFYNGEEYAILCLAEDEEAATEASDDEDSDDVEGVDCFIMKVVTTTDENGEEFDDFLPIEDEALEAKLIEVASTKLSADDEFED